MQKSSFFSGFVICFAILISAISLTGTSAFALDGATILKRLEAHFSKANADFQYSQFDDLGDRIALKDVKFSNGEFTYEIANLTLEDVEEVREEHIRLKNIVAEQFRLSSKDANRNFSLVAATISGNDIELSGSSPRNNFPLKTIRKLDFENVVIGGPNSDRPLNISSPGLSIENFEWENIDNFALGSMVSKPMKVFSVLDEEDSIFRLDFGGMKLEGLKRVSERRFELDFLEGGTLTGMQKDGSSVFDFQLGGFLMKNLLVPDYRDNTQSLFPEDDTLIDIKPLAITKNGTDIIDWEGLDARLSYEPATFNYIVDTKSKPVSLNLANATDPEALLKDFAELAEIGYERIRLDVHSLSSWNTKTGFLDLRQMKINVEEAGSIDLRMKVTGYTEKVARELGRISEQANLTADDNEKSALGLQAIASFASVGLQEFAISINDASLLNKGLNYYASQTDRNPEEVRATALLTSSIIFAQFGVPEIVPALSSALETFMQGEKTITASVRPENGLATTEIFALFAGFQAGTTTLPDVIRRLGLEVTAQ